MMYNIGTMSIDIKKPLIKIPEEDFLDLMVDACAQVICYEYESNLCSCESPRDCHGYRDFTESAKQCMNIISLFGESIYGMEYDKSKLN